MSTKIYQGYRGRFSGVHHLQNVLDRFREAAHENAVRHFHRRVARDAVDMIDDWYEQGRLPSQTDETDEHGVSFDLDIPLRCAVSRYRRRYMATRKEPVAERDPAYDPECNLKVLTDPQATPDNEVWLYFLLNTELNEHQQVFNELPEIAWFPYWDNTDRPDGVSDAAWQHRRVLWNRITTRQLDKGFGLNFEVCGPWFAGFSPDPEAVAAYIQPFEERVRRLAANRALAGLVRQRREETGDTEDLMGLTMELITDGAVEKERPKHEEAVAALIPEDLTATDLKTEIHKRELTVEAPHTP